MGGIEEVCYNIVHYLSVNKKEIVQRVICFNSDKSTCYDTHEGIDVVRVGCFANIASQSFSLAYKKELKKLLHDFQPEIVHIHVPNPLVSYYLLPQLSPRVKLIVHWHADILGKGLFYQLVKPVEKKLLQRADCILVTSLNYVDYSAPLQAFKDKILVMPNFIIPADFLYTEQVKTEVEKLKSQYGYRPLILFVGRHVPYKGLQYLLSAVPQIEHECEIIIGGTGPLTRKLKQMNKASNVHFVGRIDDDKLITYYYAADIFAFPSVNKSEAFGVVLAEAMYCYTPAITFTIEGSGVNWVNLDGITGLEVNNSDATRFAAAVNKLLANPSLKKKFACEARRRVENLFVINSIKEKLAILYA